MCGRYASFMSVADVQLAFNLDHIGEDVQELRPSWNVAPTQDVAVVVERYAQDAAVTKPIRELHMARWGLVPPWAKDLTSGPPLINARLETVDEKKSFAPSLAKRRCIVPSNGYYEWQRQGDSNSPFFIHDDELLAFAGLYSWWKASDGKWILSVTIVTREAQPPLDTIHDRMPVVLEPSEFAAWLDPDMTDLHAAKALISRPNRDLRAHRVSRAVGSIRNNTPANIEPVETH